MHNKNSLARITCTSTTVKTNHAILKAMYVTRSGNSVWCVIDGASWNFATGTVTASSVVACDTVTVNGLTYTAVCGAKGNNTQFSICGADSCVATDLAASITNDTRCPVTVSSVDVTATSCGSTVTITTDTRGTIGNDVDLSSNSQVRLAVSSSKLSGGTGNFIFSIHAVAADIHLVPYINRPAKDGIYAFNSSPGGGELVIIYE